MFTLLNGRLQFTDASPRPPEDALWLAASVPNLPPHTPVLDAACGPGTVGLALLARMPTLHVIGVDINPTLTACAEANAKLNRLTYTALTADILTTPLSTQFPCIVCNPPFYTAETHTPAQTPAKQTAHHLPTGHLTLWLTALMQALTPTGTLFLILHSACEPELLAHAQAHHHTLTLTPVQTSAKRPPKRILATLQHASTYHLTQHPVLPTYPPHIRTAVLTNGHPLTSLFTKSKT